MPIVVAGGISSRGGGIEREILAHMTEEKLRAGLRGHKRFESQLQSIKLGWEPIKAPV